MAASHSARLSPIQAQTVWTLEDGCVVERRGGQVRRFPLAELKGVRRAQRGAVLLFGRRRLTIPALSYEGLTPQDRSASFEAFIAEVTGEVPVRRARAFGREPVYWIMGLMGLGAAALLVFAAMGGAWTLGVALAARLVFVLILAAAVLPWLDRQDG
ncbi:hypothetical protein [Phenylobacterium sp.]|uniref:hypothetical protein n=1 Tax=Phenylobacterium sp. TaxID=1871053 RepID=UPI002736CE53|nr:hypothetical protein [Phenylobacterium sp.]